MTAATDSPPPSAPSSPETVPGQTGQVSIHNDTVPGQTDQFNALGGIVPGATHAAAAEPLTPERVGPLVPGDTMLPSADMVAQVVTRRGPRPPPGPPPPDVLTLDQFMRRQASEAAARRPLPPATPAPSAVRVSTAQITRTNLPEARPPVSMAMVEATRKTAVFAQNFFAERLAEVGVVPRETPTESAGKLERTVIKHSTGDRRYITLIDSKGQKPFASGSFKIVYYGQDSETGQVYAVSIIRITSDSQRTAMLEKEIEFHEQLKNIPGIAQIDAVHKTDKKWYLVTKLREYGDLFDFQRNYYEGRAIPTDRLLEASRCMLQGIIGMHNKGIVHRDIKPENFLAFKDGERLGVELTDFGLAGVEDLTKATLGGTPIYFSPETLWWAPQDPYEGIGREGRCAQTKAGDMFALGRTLYDLYTISPTEDPVHFKYLKDNANYRTYGKWAAAKSAEYNAEILRRLPKNTDAERTISKLICDLLSLDPTKRPTAQEALDRLMPLIASL